MGMADGSFLDLPRFPWKRLGVGQAYPPDGLGLFVSVNGESGGYA